MAKYGTLIAAFKGPVSGRIIALYSTGKMRCGGHRHESKELPPCYTYQEVVDFYFKHCYKVTIYVRRKDLRHEFSPVLKQKEGWTYG